MTSYLGRNIIQKKSSPAVAEDPSRCNGTYRSYIDGDLGMRLWGSWNEIVGIILLTFEIASPKQRRDRIVSLPNFCGLLNDSDYHCNAS